MSIVAVRRRGPPARLGVDVVGVLNLVGSLFKPLGLAFLLPVALSAGRHPDSRLYPRSRNAYMGWGVSLYLLGLAPASIAAAAVGV